MEQLADLHAQMSDPEVDQVKALEDLADEMAWVVTWEGATPSQIDHTLGMSQAEVEQMIAGADSEDLDDDQ